MTDVPETPAERGSKTRFGTRTVIVAALVLVALLDVMAFALFPPFPPGEPGAECAFPVCFINGTLEFPAPHVIVALTDNPTPATGGLSIINEPSITSTMVTMWIVSIGLLLVIAATSRGGPGVPGRLQNFGEWAYEMMENFAVSIGGIAARPYVPIFAMLLLLILFSNWIGLIPPVGRIEYFRAPTSDVNATIGMALVSFLIFEIEGFRKLGARKYLSKFFPIYEFRNGIGAGAIAMFVGLIELMLDFVRPLTLSMRLFGNIYGGEVALGVVTALTVFVLPVALLGLEFMLNLIQALIFSILSLMYIVLAIEDHGHEQGHVAQEAMAAVEGHPVPTPNLAHSVAH
ncbi:MAG: F0F1 ATP synthase subunit A [Chloroflexota bacterium]|nr:F0F1 ATP synthase subunit A [Chloroflexota bacterium]